MLAGTILTPGQMLSQRLVQYYVQVRHQAAPFLCLARRPWRRRSPAHGRPV